MKTFALRLRAFRCLTRRCVLRVQLWRERQVLAREEAALGLLGWQQADYDAEAQEHVNRLMDCERAQVRLTNESAALALEIERLAAQRTTQQAAWEHRRAALLAQAQPAAATVQELEARAAAQRKEGQAIEARLPVLEREAQAAEKRYRALRLDSPEAREEAVRLRKLILALPGESAEWQARLAQTRGELAAVETLLETLRAARAEFEKRDSALAGEMAAQQRAKRTVEKEIGALEKAKGDPYRAIGRVLADHGIAPLNQPETLAAVLERRGRVAAIEAAVAGSH